MSLAKFLMFLVLIGVMWVGVLAYVQHAVPEAWTWTILQTTKTVYLRDVFYVGLIVFTGVILGPFFEISVSPYSR